jgi:type II secretory pathway pseudopilin PulG
MELLVVLLIIGILSTVALRTIDATRDRGLFDQTTAEMTKLVQAMVGNPDLTFDGRRTDFGYFGDMETLPSVVEDLVRNPGSSAWHGPYLRMITGGAADSSYLFDGWGNRYTVNPNSGLLMAIGGKYDMTMKICDSVPQLYDNVITGTITDVNDAPPGDQANTYLVKLYYNNPSVHGGKDTALVVPDASGFYQFAPPEHGIPIGIHKVVVLRPSAVTDSVVRWVTTVPRSKTVVDFKLTWAFKDRLVMVGSPRVQGNNGFLIDIYNEGTNNIIVNSLVLVDAPANAWMRDFHIGTDPSDAIHVAENFPGYGKGDTITFNAPFTIAPNHTQLVEVAFLNFYDSETWPTPPGNPADLSGTTFDILFDDGSEITVHIP